MINVFWLLPLAASSIAWPQWALVWVVLAYLPLSLAAMVLGAGQLDRI
jgi:hypothetical protein